MARLPGTRDRFANIATGDVTMTAANAITFDEVLTGVSLGVGVGIIIDQIDYEWTAVSLRELLGNADQLQGAWLTSADATDLADLSDRRILHAHVLTAVIVGAVVSLWVHKQPDPYQFFPPIIVASPRIYLGANTQGAAAASRLRSRMYFRFIELSPAEYLELAETFQLTS